MALPRFPGPIFSLWALLSVPAALAEVPADARPLEPGTPVERSMAAGELHVYRARSSLGRHWRIAVEQRGIDVTLALRGPGGPLLDAADSPLDRRGLESLVVSPETAEGEVVVEVRSREPAAPPGEYRIWLEELPDSTPQGRLRLDAERARMEAAQLYAAGRLRDSLDGYRRAFDAWHRLKSPRDEARALYCVVVLLRLVGDTRQALELGGRALSGWQALDDRYWQAATLNELGLDHWTLGDNAEARRTFERALELRRAIGDRFGELKSRNNVCLTLLTEGELRRGLDCYRPLFDDLEQARELQLAAAVHTNAGWTWDRLGEPDRALEHYLSALELSRRAEDRRGQARALNNLAWLRHTGGQLEEALASYESALEIFRQLEDARWQGVVLHNVGIAYGALGEPRRALTFLRRALPVRRQAGDRRGEAATLSQLGLLHGRLGEHREALEFHRQALEVARELGDPRREAVLLQASAATRAAAGEAEPALGQAERALELARGAEERAGEAAALDLIGRIRTSMGESEAALESLEQALTLRRAIRDRPGEAETLGALARAEQSRGRLDAALAHVEAALELIEGLRLRVAGNELRATFQSTHRETYELHVELLMALHGARPEDGYHRQALAASERARARAFLDLLSEAGGDVGQGVDPALRRRRAALERRLSAKAARLSALSSRAGTAAEAATTERELELILHQLDRIEAEIRRSSPRYAELTRPQALTAGEIQRLLDPQSALLEVLLGEAKSFLWLVTPDEVAAFELPPRAEIEALARRLHQDLSSTDREDRRPQAAAAAELSRMLLAPVAERLGDRRLVVVADGALHYLPFGALPMPGGTEPLIARHEVVHLPSASVLAAQRRELASRPPAPRWLAVVADPVFGAEDPRLAGPTAAAPTPKTNELEISPTRPGPEPESFRRLPGSRREAEAIAALAPPGEALVALGLDADRTLVTGARLRSYRIVHFATHGVIDARTPRLSGLVLSLVDERGRPREGFLRLYDLYDLELGCELVVLSGCRTALGREVRGEGLVGLTRGFLYAGAQRVIASLWRVEDRATSALMTRLYRAMAIDGLRPAAALRAAQLSLLQERRWKDPYYWAGFVLVGEWRPAAGSSDLVQPSSAAPETKWDNSRLRPTDAYERGFEK